MSFRTTGHQTLALLGVAVLALIPSQGDTFAKQGAPESVGEERDAVAKDVPRPAPPTDDGRRCPYRFGSDMPPATFCVYRGVAFGSRGEVCASDVVVIWSSFGSQPRDCSTHAAADAPCGVYLAFVANPELVLRAVVDSRNGESATMTDYVLGDAAPRALIGRTTLQTVRAGPTEMVDVLSLQLREPGGFHPASCALSAYSGRFLGVMGSPNDGEADVDAFGIPGHE